MCQFNGCITLTCIYNFYVSLLIVLIQHYGILDVNTGFKFTIIIPYPLVLTHFDCKISNLLIIQTMNG
jgi:hypothetical protein